jgi:hypothetical protein
MVDLIEKAKALWDNKVPTLEQLRDEAFVKKLKDETLPASHWEPYTDRDEELENETLYPIPTEEQSAGRAEPYGADDIYCLDISGTKHTSLRRKLFNQRMKQVITTKLPSGQQGCIFNPNEVAIINVPKETWLHIIHFCTRDEVSSQHKHSCATLMLVCDIGLVMGVWH